MLDFAHELGVVCVQQGDTMRKIFFVFSLVVATFSTQQLSANDTEQDEFKLLKAEFINDMHKHSIAHSHHQLDFILKQQYLKLSTEYYQRCITGDINPQKCGYFQREFVLDEWTSSSIDTRLCRQLRCFNN